MFTYSDKVLDHFKNPRNSGALPAGYHNAITIVVGNQASGKQIKLYIAHEGKKITAIGYHVYGCVSTIATASMLSELLLATPLNELQNIHATEIFDRFELPQDRFNCALLAEMAVKKLVEALK